MEEAQGHVRTLEIELTETSSGKSVAAIGGLYLSREGETEHEAALKVIDALYSAIAIPQEMARYLEGMDRVRASAARRLAEAQRNEIQRLRLSIIEAIQALYPGASVTYESEKRVMTPSHWLVVSGTGLDDRTHEWDRIETEVSERFGLRGLNCQIQLGA